MAARLSYVPIDLLAYARKFISDLELASGDLEYETGASRLYNRGGIEVRERIFERIDAKKRIDAMVVQIGEDDFQILKAVLLYGAGVKKLKEMSGVHNNDIKKRIIRAISDVMDFYCGVEKNEEIALAAKKIIEADVSTRH